jgi:hypothetical protein
MQNPGSDAGVFVWSKRSAVSSGCLVHQRLRRPDRSIVERDFRKQDIS